MYYVLVPKSVKKPAVDDGVYSVDGTCEAGISMRKGLVDAQTNVLYAYPNPFNPSTVIGFTVLKETPVRLSIYDVLGRQVRVLVQGTVAEGTHEVLFEARDLPGGRYFYRLETATAIETRSFLLLK